MATASNEKSNFGTGVRGLLALVAGCAIFALFALNSRYSWSWLWQVWSSDADYSHGFLVPLFSLFLLWVRRPLAPRRGNSVTWPAVATGVGLILGAAALANGGIYTRMLTMEAAAILPLLLGISLCCGGWAAGRWAAPSILFLVFMIPLPAVIGSQFAITLKQIATVSSTFSLQLLGIHAVAEGNTILLPNATLEVAEACNGLRMLTCFFALASAICLMSDRALIEKCLILASAPLIAILSNVIRITATGIAFELGDQKFAEMIFHDFAGWMMMPVALFFLWIETGLLTWLFEAPAESDLPLIGASSAGLSLAEKR